MSVHVLTLIGPDRAGLVRDVAAALEQSGGNWLASRLARMGGHFAGVVEISLPDEAGLAPTIERWRAAGLECVAHEGAHAGTAEPGFVCEIDVQGNDRPGIVSAVSRVIADCGGNVETLDTEVLSAPMAGGPIFQMRGVIRLADDEAAAAALQAALESLGPDLAVDLSAAAR